MEEKVDVMQEMKGSCKVDFVSSGRKGADSAADIGINLTKWCMLPINDLNCFRVLGFSNWIIASVFRLVGVMPSELILYPKHVISVRPNSHLCKLMARFLLSNLSRVLSISFSCFSSVPFEMIIMSSRNALVAFILSSDVSIISGMLLGGRLERRNR